MAGAPLLHALPLAAAAPAEADDASLIARILAGDPAAEQALFRRHAGAVGGMLARLVGRSQEAEDLLQETFIAAFAALDGLRERGALRAWLLRIAVRKARRAVRKRKFLEALGLVSGVDDTALDALAARDAGPEDRAELALVQRMLAQLPAKDRIAWMLRHVEGLSLDEIAAATGASLATVKRRITAARERIDVGLAGKKEMR